MIIFHGISHRDWTAPARIPIVGRFEDRNRFKRRTMESKRAQFKIGQVVKHRLFPFRGVIFDVDPQFSNTEEWWLSIPEDVRPHKDQPFYHPSPRTRRRTTWRMSRNRTCWPMNRASRSRIRKWVLISASSAAGIT